MGKYVALERIEAQSYRYTIDKGVQITVNCVCSNDSSASYVSVTDSSGNIFRIDLKVFELFFVHK